MVADDALYLLIGEGDGMFREREGIHVCRQRCYGYGGVRAREHFRPCTHMCFVYVLDEIFKAELKGVISIAEYLVNRENVP